MRFSPGSQEAQRLADMFSFTLEEKPPAKPEKRTTLRLPITKRRSREWIEHREPREIPEDTPCLENGRDNCDDWGTGEGRWHGRM